MPQATPNPSVKAATAFGPRWALRDKVPQRLLPIALGCHGHVEAAMKRSNIHLIKPMMYHKTFPQAPDLHSKVYEKKFLYLIGYGINYAADRTIIADQYIADSEVLFALESDIEHIKANINGREVVNLISLYQQGVSRSVAYAQIAQTVLAAFSSHSRVGLLVEGSPFFLDSICELLQERSSSLGIDVVYVDGRSSLDVIIQTLQIPLQHGIGIYLAESYCADRGVLNPESVNIFFQPGNVGTENIQMHGVDIAGVRTLKDALFECYEPSQRWLLISLGQSTTVSTKIIWNYLSDLDSFYSYMHSGTLVISKNWWPADLHGVLPTEIEG